MKTSKMLAAILALQGLILIGQWSGGANLLSSAHAADVPDPANRQMQMIDELKAVNAKLDKLIEVLESGTIQVKPVRADDNNKANPPARK
jgi:hypothetical protein